MKNSGFNNALLRVALSLLLVAVQACGTANKYQTTSSQPPLENRQALLELVAVEYIGEAKEFQLQFVNGVEMNVLPGNEIEIPAGNVQLEVQVEWSNEFVEEPTIRIDAEAGAIYRLAVFELKERLKKLETPPTSSSPDSLGDAMAEGFGMGLIIALLPWIIVTSPIWYPIGMALEDERPFPDCCFVWVEKVDGGLAYGKVPPEPPGVRPSQQAREGGVGNTVTREYSGELGELCRDADSGEADALYRIGDLYWFGTPPAKQNFTRAYVWYSLAAAKGHYWAEKAVLRTRDYLIESDLARAEGLIKSWGPGQCQMELNPEPAEQLAE